MVSPARQNRLNARKSTGPQSTEGKARSCMNALKHGVFAANLLVEGDDPQELAIFRLELLRCLRPCDLLQLQYAEQYIGAAWKLKRLQGSEVVLYNDRTNERKEFFRTTPQAPPITPAYVLADFLWQNPQIHRMQMYEQRLFNRMNRAYAQLKLIQKQSEQGDLEFYQHLIESEASKLQNEADPEDPSVTEAKTEACDPAGEPLLPPQDPVDQPQPGSGPEMEPTPLHPSG